MEIRSALLSSNIARGILGQYATQSELSQALRAIDRLGELHDALRQARAAKSPAETPEARALRYEKQFRQAYDKAREVAAQAAVQLDRFAQDAQAAALQRSGLSVAPFNASEIRGALRSMPDADRKSFVVKAFEKGDTAILSAIFGQHEILWGGIGGPVEGMFEEYLNRSDPERAGRLEAADEAQRALSLASEEFTNKATEWRDPAALERGQQQEAEFTEASGALQRALEG